MLAGAASSATMAEVLTRVLGFVGKPGAEQRIAKSLADFDLRSLRRLERTRLLVRAGPGARPDGHADPALARALRARARRRRRS